MSASTENKPNKKKGFFGRMMEKLDKKLEEKSRKAPCCGNSSKNKEKGSSCC